MRSNMNLTPRWSGLQADALRVALFFLVAAGCLGQSCGGPLPPLVTPEEPEEQVLDYQPPPPPGAITGDPDTGGWIADPPSEDPLSGGDPTNNETPAGGDPQSGGEPLPELRFEIVASTDSGPAPLSVTFSPRTMGNQPLPEAFYEWDFGDGHTAEGPYVSHVFQTAGKYTVLLCVAFSAGGCSEFDSGRSSPNERKPVKADRLIQVTMDPVAASPSISPDGGSFDGPVEVSLASATAGADIRFTLDGSQPSNASARYDAPFLLDHSATVRALAFADGYQASSESSAQFVITINNAMPVAVSQADVCVQGVPKLLTLQGSPAPLAFIIRSLPASGTLTDAGDNRLISAADVQAGTGYALSGDQVWYTPDQPGAYAFDFVAHNGVSFSNPPATRTLNVSPVGTLVVTPDTGWVVAGPQGGPFNPPTMTYTLSNPGATQIAWSASGSKTWITLNLNGGVLAPGATATLVASLNAEALNLAAGLHTATLAFLNLTNAIGNTSRSVSLTAQASAATLSVSPAEGFYSSGTQGTQITNSKTYTLTNTGGQPLDWSASADVNWVTVTPAGGTLAGGTGTTVTVALNANVASLAAGTHLGTLTLPNANNGLGSTTRPLAVTIVAPGAQPMTTASRTSGVAPLGVFFNAVDTESDPAHFSGVVQPTPTLIQKTIDSQPTNITGVSVMVLTQGTSTGNGTLWFTKATNSFTWAAPGDDPGSPVAFTASGTQAISSANGQKIGLAVTLASLPDDDASDVIIIGSELHGDYASFHYEWDFGDPESGVWVTNGRSKNTAFGYIAAHVYDEPGTYTVTLNMLDHAGTEYTYTQTIEVLPFTGTTYYVSSSHPDRNDANAGTDPELPLATFSVAMGKVATNTRILFNRGDTWPVNNTIWPTASGPVILGAYGSGERPLFEGSEANILDMSGAGSDWRIVDLDFRYTEYDFDTNAGARGDAVRARPSNTLVYRCRFRRCRLGINDRAATGRTGLGTVECEFHENSNYGQYTAVNSDNQPPATGVYVLGSEFDGVRDEHLLRVMVSHTLVSSCTFTRNQAAGHAIKMAAPTMSGPGPYKANRFSIVSDNIIVGVAWITSFGTQSASALQSVEDVVIERNVIRGPGGEGGAAIHTRNARRMTIRNNTFDSVLYVVHMGAPAIAMGWSEVRLLNNSWFSGGTSIGYRLISEHPAKGMTWNWMILNNAISLPLTPSAGGGSLIIADRYNPKSVYTSDHNLFYIPLHGANFRVETSETKESLNTWRTATGSDSASITADPGFANPADGDFRVAASSPCIGNGDALAAQWVRIDFMGRPRDSAPDIGAYEYWP